MDTHDKKLDQASGVSKGNARSVAQKDLEAYWSERFSERPYVVPGSSFDDYGPAYRYGVDVVRRYEARSFDDVEDELRGDWKKARGSSKLDWNQAKHAVRDAWDWVKTDIDHD
jgi:hypothetical protein